jgi:predicted MFS family arabinose efflux permease
MEKFLRNPLNAALFAAAVTAAAVYFTLPKKSEKEPVKNSVFTKPALFVGLLVYFIVYSGNSKFETISKEPF